ncbi:MAG: multiheme c-type cytochrome [Limisphaerales bacterium]
MRCCIKALFKLFSFRPPRTPWRFDLILFSALLFSGCGESPKLQTIDLPVYFTCDIDGRLEPCGCFTGQFGGLTRLKTVLDAEAPDGALRVDVGDAVGGREDYDLIEYGYLLRAFAAMKYDALNIGQHEARFTVAQLRAIKQTSPVPILSANLLDQATHKPVFDSYRVVQRGAFRIAVVGVLDPRGLEQKLGAGLLVGDMDSAIERCLAELRGKADLIVLLAFTDEATLTRLAQQFYECQVILGGKVSQPAQDLVKANRSLIYFVTNESKALGILRLQLLKGAPLQVTGNEVRLLHDKISQDASFHELAQSYRDEVRQTRLAVDDPDHLSADMVPGVRTVAVYVGTESCFTCHKTAADAWASSAHAHAFATLTARKADADPKCIGCHTVGFGDASGYRREFGADKLINVGCESCHGPGSLHVRQKAGDASINFTFRPLDAGDCQKCHYGEFSRPFVWNQFWPLIQHGKEPVSQPVKLTP